MRNNGAVKSKRRDFDIFSIHRVRNDHAYCGESSVLFVAFPNDSTANARLLRRGRDTRFPRGRIRCGGRDSRRMVGRNNKYFFHAVDGTAKTNVRFQRDGRVSRIRRHSNNVAPYKKRAHPPTRLISPAGHGNPTGRRPVSRLPNPAWSSTNGRTSRDKSTEDNG